MTPSRIRAPIVPLAYEPADAAAALDVGLTFFAEQVAPEIRCVRRGAKRLYPVSELQAWLERNAARTLNGGARS